MEHSMINDQFTGKVVLVTGGGRGMGKEVGEAFAARGAKVMLAARNIALGEAVAEQLRQQGGTAATVQAENSDRASMKAMVENTVATFGGLDIVVHCAAHWVQNEVVDMAETDFDAMINSNIQSLFWLAKDTQPYLSQAKDKGRLFFISSASADRMYVPGLICYTATKTYMNYFSRGLAVELGKRNILVNVVEPGLTASDRVKSNLDMSVLNSLTAHQPVPRPGSSEDVASAVLFLASKEASYMTGSSILVDGGHSLCPPVNFGTTLNEIPQ
jgi:3-oxoacyl-[acyl-carrier protein] reductase